LGVGSCGPDLGSKVGGGGGGMKSFGKSLLRLTQSRTPSIQALVKYTERLIFSENSRFYSVGFYTATIAAT